MQMLGRRQENPYGPINLVNILIAHLNLYKTVLSSVLCFVFNSGGRFCWWKLDLRDWDSDGVV